MSEFQTATQFQLETLTIDGKDVRPMFFSIECYENIFISAVTGNVTLVDTSSNQMLSKMKIEGNEELEWGFKTPTGKVEFKDTSTESMTKSSVELVVLFIRLSLPLLW